MFKLVKWALIGGVVVVGLGALFFGTDLFSYAFTSGRMLKTAVNDSIPIQFEIQRARDLLEGLIPEMHANLRIVAQEEVELAGLEKDVTREHEALASQRGQIQKMRNELNIQPASYAPEGSQKSALEDLSLRFERFRASELLYAEREKLLSNRRKSLQAAIQKLERTRFARVQLAAQIENLESQVRILQAQGSSAQIQIDDTKLAQTQRLLGDLKKRLEVAQKVLEKEVQFSDMPPAPSITAENLAEQIDTHFHKKGTTTGSGAPAKPSPATLPAAQPTVVEASPPTGATR